MLDKKFLELILVVGYGFSVFLRRCYYPERNLGFLQTRLPLVLSVELGCCIVLLAFRLSPLFRPLLNSFSSLFSL